MLTAGLGLLGVVLVVVGGPRSAPVAAGGAVPRPPAVAAPQGGTDQASAGAPSPGRRVVRLQLEAAALAPGLRAGAVVDVLAAVADGQAPGGGRVDQVADGRVVAMAGTGSAVTVDLDVDATAVAKVLWAQAFAKAVQIVARPPGEAGSP